VSGGHVSVPNAPVMGMAATRNWCHVPHCCIAWVAPLDLGAMNTGSAAVSHRPLGEPQPAGTRNNATMRYVAPIWHPFTH
jgi:hypothetical protein